MNACKPPVKNVGSTIFKDLNQFKDEGNLREENSLASSDEENEENGVDEDFVTYQL